MAQVDFTNAHIEPVGSDSSIYKENDVSLKPISFYNASGSSIASPNYTVTKNESNNLVYTYTGSFYASGTEFYLYGYNMTSAKKWRVYNINFASGDTFNFKISAKII